VLSSSVGRGAGGKLDASQVRAHEWPNSICWRKLRRASKSKGPNAICWHAHQRRHSGNLMEACSPGPKREKLGAEDLSGT
jgi:hypothetical protein